MLGGCYGKDEKAVFDELCQIVEGTIVLYRKDGKPLPPSLQGAGLYQQKAMRRLVLA